MLEPQFLPDLHLAPVPMLSQFSCTVPLSHIRWRAMRQRILGSHTPPCHRRMVITT